MEMTKSLEDLELTVRAYNCLRRAGVQTLSDIADLVGTDLSALNFRRSMLLWNPACEDTLVLLGDGEEFHSRPLKDTLP